MAWTTPKTWASEPLISTDLNTHVRDNLNHLKGRLDGSLAAQYAVSATHSTTSLTFVDMDATNLSFELTTTGGDVMVTFVCLGFHDTAGRRVELGIHFDGADHICAYGRFGNDGVPINFVQIFNVPAGTYTFKMRFRVSAAGTGTVNQTFLFDVREIVGLGVSA